MSKPEMVTLTKLGFELRISSKCSEATKERARRDAHAWLEHFKGLAVLYTNQPDSRIELVIDF